MRIKPDLNGDHADRSEAGTLALSLGPREEDEQTVARSFERPFIVQSNGSLRVDTISDGSDPRNRCSDQI